MAVYVAADDCASLGGCRLLRRGLELRGRVRAQYYAGRVGAAALCERPFAQ